MVLTDCYEKGHTPDADNYECVKCGKHLYSVTTRFADGEHTVWHTLPELDRLWKGVDREAARILTEPGSGDEVLTTYEVRVGRLWLSIDFEAQAVLITWSDEGPPISARTEEIVPGTVLVDRDTLDRVVAVEVLG